MTTPSWSIAIFTSREDVDTLQRTVEAVLSASTSHRTTVDVLVDHNAATAAALARRTPAPLPAGSTLRLWLVPWQDKACTWNRYLHEIAPRADVAYFIDGYVRPRPDSLLRLGTALATRPAARAASGVPTVGASAAVQRATLLTDGGLHGNLYALRGATVDWLRRHGFRLPLGLYRNDSLIGAVAAFAGDPAREAWAPTTRIAVVADASWDNDLPSLGVERVRTYLKRRMRQAQGDLENAAIRDHLAIRKQPPEMLPHTVEGLLATGPHAAIGRRGVLGRLLMRRAAARVAVGRDWSRCTEPAQLLRTWEGP